MKYEPFQDSPRKSFVPVKVVRMKAHKKLSTVVTVIALLVTSLTPSMHEDEFHFRMTIRTSGDRARKMEDLFSKE